MSDADTTTVEITAVEITAAILTRFQTDGDAGLWDELERLAARNDSHLTTRVVVHLAIFGLAMLRCFCHTTDLEPLEVIQSDVLRQLRQLRQTGDDQ